MSTANPKCSVDCDDCPRHEAPECCTDEEREASMLHRENERLRREAIEQEAVNLEIAGELEIAQKKLDGMAADANRFRDERDDLRGQLFREREDRQRLSRELTEARADISVLRADRDRIRTVSAEALALRDRLSTIVDEAFGTQPVLGADALLSRLEHLLTERALQHEEVRRELDKLGADRHDALARRRAAAQILIAEIGASGPEDVEETARRAVRRIEALRHELSEASAGCRLQVRTETDLRRERDEARANYQFMVERAADQRLGGYRELGARAAAAENERDAVRVALRNLIASVTATKTRDTIVLRDLEAARAVLGSQS